MSCKETNYIEVIKGDTCEIGVTITGVELETIEAVYVSSEKLGICQELIYNEDDECYDFYLAPEETEKLDVGFSDFDITVKFIDSNVLTPMYRETFAVYEKTNKVGCIANE